MKTATEKINRAALQCEDAQEEIRQIIKNAFIYNEIFSNTEKRIKKVIDNAVKDIKIQRLKESVIRSLWAFANAQKNIWQAMPFPAFVVLFLGARAAGETTTKNETKVLEYLQIKGFYETDAKGVPLNKFYGDVWKEKVKPVLDRLAEQKALDPNDFTGRNSLRNLAEMEVRYNDHLEQIDGLKKSGAKLVVASAHADCSKRCAPWQGKIYSLDGSFGKIDGHNYQPLENATDVYYTTKAGITYKNGLLGFNCRHYLREYKGEFLPYVGEKERKKEYKITLKQRELERAVRAQRAKASMYQDTNKAEYLKARTAAKRLYDEYKKFSLDNNRAYYPMRVRI